MEEELKVKIMVAAKVYVGSIVRHALTAAGAILVTKGIADQDAVNSLATGVTEILTGSVFYLGSQIWSLIQKSKTSGDINISVEKKLVVNADAVDSLKKS